MPGNYSALSALLYVISYKRIDAFTRVKSTPHYLLYFLAINRDVL